MTERESFAGGRQHRQPQKNCVILSHLFYLCHYSRSSLPCHRATLFTSVIICELLYHRATLPFLCNPEPAAAGEGPPGIMKPETLPVPLFPPTTPIPC